MRLNEVINRFALVSGLESSQISTWVPLCVDAMNEISGMAVGKAHESSADSLRLSNLAGVLAYYKYTLYTLDNVKSFSAGDVSVTTTDSAVKHAKLLWETECSLAKDLLCPDEFYFGRVKM